VEREFWRQVARAYETNERAQRALRRQGFRREGCTKDDELGERIGLWVRDL
jgi:RimJ/RimL family protein N-acetyltransferase